MWALLLVDSMADNAGEGTFSLALDEAIHLNFPPLAGVVSSFSDLGVLKCLDDSDASS